MQNKHSIIMEKTPLGKLFFLRLENALLLGQKGDSYEILSDFDDLEQDLKAWCVFKGEQFLEKKSFEHYTTYTLTKKSPNKFEFLNIQDENFQNEILNLAPTQTGLAARGSQNELANPNYHFELVSKEEIWSQNLNQLYEDSKKAQWNASKDIEWNEIGHYDKKMEFAIAQIMTYLVENELSALYIPAKFLAKISPYYTEVPLLLSSIIGDEARHIETFIKRAKATGLGLQYSTLTTQQSLFTLFKEEDYFKSSFLLHIMGEGTFIDLLQFLEVHSEDEPTKKLFNLARKDEARHVVYGMNNVKTCIASNPKKIELLKDAVFKRKHYLDELSGESTLLIESLALFAGKGSGASQIRQGFELVELLKQKMETNRTKRLVECGIDEDLAYDLSRAHTPNFM